MARAASRKFDPATFLAQAGPGRQLFKLKPNQAFFAQGGPADSIFYLQTGCAKLTVVSEKGLEATIALFSAGDRLQDHRQMIGHREVFRPKCADLFHPHLAGIVACLQCDGR